MTGTLTIRVINFVTPTPPAEQMNNVVLNIELTYGLQLQKIACLILTPYLTHKETELSTYFLVFGTMVSQIL